MLKPVSEVVGAKLVDLEGSQTIGEVSDWIVDPDKLKITALVIKKPGIFSGQLFVTTIDVIEYGPGIVVVRTPNAVVGAKEVVGLSELLSSKYRMMQEKVETQSGKVLGKVEDVIFETIDSTIQKLHVRRTGLSMLATQDLIITTDKIVKIEQRRIVVSDDVVDAQTSRIAHSEA